MIDIYTGTPGSGKSLHCAKDIRTYIGQLGKPVITNFPFQGMQCNPKEYGGHLYIRNQEMTPEKLYQFSEMYRKKIEKERIPEEDILLCIDEAQIIFNSRSWQTGDRAGWNEFFTQHRKLGYHVILIAQYLDMIDKQMRAVIEYEYVHRKVGNIGKGGNALSSISGGNLHICIKYYAPLKMKVSTQFFKADKSLYGLYDSYSVFQK